MVDDFNWYDGDPPAAAPPPSPPRADPHTLYVQNHRILNSPVWNPASRRGNWAAQIVPADNRADPPTRRFLRRDGIHGHYHLPRDTPSNMRKGDHPSIAPGTAWEFAGDDDTGRNRIYKRWYCTIVTLRIANNDAGTIIVQPWPDAETAMNHATTRCYPRPPSDPGQLSRQDPRRPLADYQTMELIEEIRTRGFATIPIPH